MILQADGISKSYHAKQRRVQALSTTSLRAEAGEILAICGPSGSGKSTLLLCCGGLLACESGVVRIDGTDPYRLFGRQREAFLATKVGFTFQQFCLIPYLCVLDNVMVAASRSDRSGLRNRAVGLLEEFGLRERMDHLPGELSMGERQRTALARAMLNEPPLLLADEPTGNLDSVSSRTVMAALVDYAKRDRAVLLATHDEDARSLAHRTLELRGGRRVGAPSR